LNEAHEEVQESSQLEQIVDAEEIKHSPDEKVQVDGALEFKFNVPIAKYTSNTS